MLCVTQIDSSSGQYCLARFAAWVPARVSSRGPGRAWLNDSETSVRLGVDQEASQVGWSFVGDQRLRKKFAQTGIRPENRLCLLQKTGEVRHRGSHVVTKGVLCTSPTCSLRCSTATLGKHRTLSSCSSMVRFGYPRLFSCPLKSLKRISKVASSETITRKYRARLYGRLRCTCGGWLLVGKRYWCVSVAFVKRSVTMVEFSTLTVTSKKSADEPYV